MYNVLRAHDFNVTPPKLCYAVEIATVYDFPCLLKSTTLARINYCGMF